MNPSGTVLVNYGANRPFTISPNSGYDISNVTVDGVSQGPISAYTFMNVVTNHTISAVFATATPPTLRISANGSGGLDIVWPDTYSGQLLWSPTIGPGAAWNPVGTTPVHVGGQYRVAITPTAAESFYGLGR